MAANLKYYRKLKSLMFEKEVDQAYIAKKTGRSKAYISERFQGNKPFNLNDVYVIMDILQIPPEELLTYFPRGGIAGKREAKSA